MKATSIEKTVSSWGLGINPERWELLLQNLQSEDRVLDYGCGQGAYVHALAQQKNLHCVGMDLFDYPGWENCAEKSKFQTCDGNTIPAEDNTFDVSYAFEVLEHCHNPGEMLRELKRVTGRTLLVSVPNCFEEDALKTYSFAPRHWIDQTHVNFWTAESFKEFAEQEGCKVLAQHPVFKLDLCRCYWESTDLPSFFKKVLYRLFSTVSRSFYSSTLLVISCKES
ncbi:class I SAM-dependent methyltransferase [Kiritimatiellaeota bacterium B1221]|nr:class I SAM-dependent methyltransferase [Kiritimatiellaeota bacterium B1221]